jgi:hypothetical protein
VAEHDQLGVDSADTGIPGEFCVEVLDGLGELGIGALAFARPRWNATGSNPGGLRRAART